jgi:hypothetical protein
MADDLTPWEEINPVTVSARQAGPVSRCSETEDRLTFRNELTACLALTAPVGMTEEAKRDWLAVAWSTLSHIPADILVIGTMAARQKCDHPSKIVPTIIAETAQSMAWRRDGEAARYEHMALPAPKPEYCSPEDAQRILSEYGLKRDWSAEVSPGSKPTGRDHADGLGLREPE